MPSRDSLLRSLTVRINHSMRQAAKLIEMKSCNECGLGGQYIAELGMGDSIEYRIIEHT